jgi:hypothetical protein
MMSGNAAFPTIPVHHVLVWCIAVNVKFLHTISKKVLEMCTFTSQLRVTSNKHIAYCTSKFRKLSELMESDW